MPKAKPFSEDEKTTIESQWEDEASTTVEQGEVADKINALDSRQKHPITNITNTNGSSVDEPTVDDQHMSNLETPQVVPPARLSVTAGNDAGIELEIHPGKTYTIGRGLDNDFVLTDIAVSRKHFDLRNEDGSWILVDRGSGNGTVVNGNLEDNAFMLANGDMIEIGNTTFRFDHQNADVSRGRDVEFDDADDEEMSTVAGKPLNQKIADTPLGGEAPSHSVSQRPKTLPPPTPLRPRNPSQAPYAAASKPTAQAPAQMQPMQMAPVQMPATTLPMPQMANRPPISGPQSPTILGGEPMQLNQLLNNVMPTTIPGQGSPLAPAMLPMQQMAPMQLHPMYGNGYPQATEIPPHSVHAQMLVVQSQNRRGDLSTAHVPPVPYGSALAGPMPASRYMAPPAMSKRTKYLIGGAAITLFAAVFTIVIIKSGSKTKAQPTGNKSISSIKQDPKVAIPPPKTPTPAVPTVTPPVQPPQTLPPKQDPPKQTPPPPVVASNTPPKQTPTVTSPPPTVTPPKQEPTVTPPKQEPPKPPKQNPPKQTPKDPPKQTVRQTPKPDKPRQNPKPPPEPKKQRVATSDTDKPASGGNTDALEQKAETLYQSKKFTEASNVLAQASKVAGASSTEGKRLSGKATRMANFGRAYNNGTAPASKAVESFISLRSAANFDQALGGAYEAELREKIAAIAPRAAIAFVAARDLGMAHTAVIEAEHYGNGTSDTIKAVKGKLETEAGSLYAAGMKLGSNPDSAREKFKQIKTIVDSKSQWYQKADKQLGTV